MVKILSGGINIGNGKQESFSSSTSNRPQRSHEEPIEESNLPGEFITSDEGIGGTLVRGTARTGARALETAVGIPGDIVSAGLGAANYLSGGKVPSYSQIQEKLPISLPTSENVKQAHEKYTGEYLKPQGSIEEAGDTLTSLITSLITPLSGAAGLASKAKLGQAVSKLPRAAKIGAAAVGSSELVKQLGGSELAGEYTKLGVLLASGVPGARKYLENLADNAYDTLKNLSGSNKYIRAPKLKNLVKNLLEETNVGHLTPEKKEVQGFLNSVEKAFERGGLEKPGIQVKEAGQLEKDINKLINHTNLPHGTVPHLLDIKKEITSALDKFGKTNTRWGKEYSESKEIWRTLNARSKVSKFLEKNFDLEDFFNNKLTKSVLFGGAIYNLPKTAAVTAGGIAASELLKAVELFARSPQAKKYYWDAFKAAAKENKNGFINSGRKLDKIVSEEAPEEFSPIESSSKGFKILSGGFKS